MNTAQLIRQAAFDLNAVLQNSTTDPFFRLEAMLSWATDANNQIEKHLRTAKEDYGLLLLQSDDDAYTWCGVTYDPGSLTMVPGTKMYTLPPDLLLLKSIRLVDDTSTVFEAKDVSAPDFAPVDETVNASGSNVIYFDVVGENTLLLGSDPPDAEVEITYIARPAPLQIESTGTISINYGSAVVSGSNTAWVVDGLLPNLELIISDDATAPKILSQTSGGTWVDPSALYYPVSTITGDGTLTLLANWGSASITNRGYMLASVPTIPREHHQTIVDYICYRALRARRSAASEVFRTAYKDGAKDIRSDKEDRQEQSPVFIESWEP